MYYFGMRVFQVPFSQCFVWCFVDLIPNQISISNMLPIYFEHSSDTLVYEGQMSL